MYSEFEYYSNNILFVIVFGHNSEPEYYSYSYSAKYLCTNIIRIRIRSFWENKYYSYSYSIKILIPNIICICIQSKKQYSLTSEAKRCHQHVFATVSNNYLHPPTCLARRTVTSFLGTCYTYLAEEIARTVQTLNVSCIKKRWAQSTI